MQTLQLTVENSLPNDWQRATLVGRVWLPGERGGPAVVVIRDGEVIDCTPVRHSSSLRMTSLTRRSCTWSRMSMLNQSIDRSNQRAGDHTKPAVHESLVSGFRSLLPTRLRMMPSRS